jgi:succinate dehydrogenase / fumarate reductase cytochrome b subunit
MISRKRPLSPHLQIYKLQITAFTSILHRATGIFLYIGVIVMCWAIIHYSYQINIEMENGETECYCPWKNVLHYALYLTILGWAFSLYYHLCNGIRHLFWDIGKGFEINTAKKTGIIVIILSIFLTAFSAFIVLSQN